MGWTCVSLHVPLLGVNLHLTRTDPVYAWRVIARVFGCSLKDFSVASKQRTRSGGCGPSSRDDRAMPYLPPTLSAHAALPHCRGPKARPDPPPIRAHWNIPGCNKVTEVLYRGQGERELAVLAKCCINEFCEHTVQQPAVHVCCDSMPSCSTQSLRGRRA